MILSDELRYWDDLSLEFMTEESDDEDDFNCIIEHKLPWRSAGMSIILVTVYNVYSGKLYNTTLTLHVFGSANLYSMYHKKGDIPFIHVGGGEAKICLPGKILNVVTVETAFDGF